MQSSELYESCQEWRGVSEAWGFEAMWEGWVCESGGEGGVVQSAL